MILNNTTCGNIKGSKYDTCDIETSIVHIGLGAFFKAHFATYIDNYNSLGEDIWLIEALSLKTNNAKLLMMAQDCKYTVHLNGSKNSSFKSISCVKKALFLGEDKEYILDLMSSRSVKIITLTITEKGYCYNPSLKGLDVKNIDIVSDLEEPCDPKSAVGLLCMALRIRKNRGFDGVTIMSCDNLPSNGKILKKVVLDFAEIINKDLKNWIERMCTFPSTMVDRIVPKITDDSLKQIKQKIGMDDFAGIVCEDFAQFVIEDKFVKNQKPNLSKVGVLFVEDIQNYENMKLRVLNGTHSALAYMGQLLKKETVFEAMRDRNIENFIKTMLAKEIIPTLQKVDGVNFDDYSKNIIKRYKNPNIVHKTVQISADGSQKLPQRWLESIRFLIDNDKRYEHFALCLACWIKFTSSRDIADTALHVNDPLAEVFKKIWIENNSVKNVVESYFKIKSIFDISFLKEKKLMEKVSNYLSNIDHLEDMIEGINNENDI